MYTKVSSNQKFMRVLVVPAHLNLSPSLGSEEAWTYDLLSRLVMNFNVKIDAICGKAENFPWLSNLRIFSTGFSKGDLLDQSLFRLRYYSIAKKLCKHADLVHHIFPFGFKVGFNPLAISGHLRSKPFVIGPIHYPQKFSDITDYAWLTGRKGPKASLLYQMEMTILRAISSFLESLHKITLEEAEILVFESVKALELYKNTYPDILKGKRLKVILRAVEIVPFSYTPLVKKNCLKILTVGYLLKRKGIQFLIKAMPNIIREIKNVKLEIVGDGPLKKELMKLAKNMFLEEYITFRGYIPRSELQKIYADCDVYVQPSLSEAFPSAVREAMAIGRPVVVTRVGYAEEVIKNGKNGYLVPPGNSEALSQAIIRLLTNEKLRIEMGMKAKRYVENKLSWDSAIKQWYEVYKEAVL